MNKNWIKGQDYPEWGDNDLYYSTIKSYLQENETPATMYKRLAVRANSILVSQLNVNLDNLQQRIYEILWNGWLIPATPVAVNFGTKSGLPISCFSGVVPDDMYGIFRKNAEMAVLSKNGGGTAYDFSEVRPMGAPIRGGNGGTSDGIIPFIKAYDSSIIAAKQSRVRRGAVAIYLDINHEEYENFLTVREPKGEINRQCLNIHHGAVIDDAFMEKVINENGKERELWMETLKARQRTGEPYLFFKDNANKNLPDYWTKQGLSVKHSNLCTEIFQPTDTEHTLTCCLSSMNCAKFDEWKNTDAVYIATLFLNAVIQEFINKAKYIQGIEDAVRQAMKSRSIGLGLLGWHTYLQSHNLPFVSVMSNSLTHKIFGLLKTQSLEASRYMYQQNLNNIPEWLKESDQFNMVMLAVAPNRSSSKLAGGVSQSVEPIAANVYVDDDSKGLHIRVNPLLEKLLKEKDQYSTAVINDIAANKGSVQHLDFLSDDEKQIFLTFKEINQLEIVRQAAIRQQYIDQGQSINLAFAKDAEPKWINKVHVEAWKLGLKSLYYFRSESSVKADNIKDLYNECLMCEG